MGGGGDAAVDAGVGLEQGRPPPVLVLLGERGQGKTRLLRTLVGLLDEVSPVVRGGELNDDPFAPVSPAARAIVERDGDATSIDWLPRDRRAA